MPATMKDVAELSGVCAATVSKYLSGVRVKEKNRKAIEEAVAKLHFKPNAFARNLRTNTSMTVGILLPELDNIFSMTIISHLENSLISQGYSTVICDYKTNAAHECEKLRFLLEKKVDGLVVMPFSLTANQLNDIPVPIVLIDRKVEGFLGSTVLLNNAEAAFEAVSSLIEQANSRIGILCGPQDIYTTKKRLEGYLNAHRAYGLPVDDSLVLFGQYDRESGYALTKALLSSENPPTALFATNNETTIGAVLALNDMGFTIGKDIGFVGFDSLEGSQIYPPHFSIVLQPLHEIADETARLLLSGIKKEQAAQEVCLKAKWIPQGEIQNYILK